MALVHGVRMSRTAVVTGASGYIATEVVKQLLEKGYNVRGTVRNTSDPSKVGHLRKLADALPGTLELMEADLEKLGSFELAIKGADYVFHMASPFILSQLDDPQKQMIDPAVKGTTNVLDTVGKHNDTVKRVVLTSSFAAMRSIANPAPPKASDGLYSEADWNEGSTLETEPYLLSKTLAEKAAWDSAKQHGIDLVVINPVFVIGPVVSARGDATSINILKNILEGGPARSHMRFGDVRDIAKAHVLAAENPSASGRYIVGNDRNTTARMLTNVLKALIPDLDIEDGEEADAPKMVNNGKVQRELGMALTPAETSIRDMATTLIQLGVAKPKLRQ